PHRGTGAGSAGDGRGRPLLHRCAHAGVGHDQSAPGRGHRTAPGPPRSLRARRDDERWTRGRREGGRGDGRGRQVGQVVTIDVTNSLREAFFMFWHTLWPLVLGFT